MRTDEALEAASLEPGRSSYSRGAMWLHWIIAALIAANLATGLLHEHMEKPVRQAMMYWHKPLGISILVLTLVRIAWRLSHRPPAFDAALRAWEVTLARAVHGLFYLLLVAMPISGWLVVSSGRNRIVDFFGLVRIPPLPVRGEEIHDLMESSHEVLGYLMLIVLALHVAGALKHHLDGHRHLIGRMAPWLYRRSA